MAHEITQTLALYLLDYLQHVIVQRAALLTTVLHQSSVTMTTSRTGTLVDVLASVSSVF